MAASENVTKHVKMKYAETASYGLIFLDQRFWSLERIEDLINHILENQYGFVTNLRYHAMNIRSWLNSIFMITYANQHEISEEIDIFKALFFCKVESV